MRRACVRVAAGWIACASALAQAPDTILFNGRIVTLDARSSVHQALAIRDGRIVALGTNAQIRKLVGRESRGQDSIVDLKGRTVIPGLIDSHMHAIRAALSFSTEVNWIGTKSIAEALSRLRDAAKTRKPGEWLIVAGGWTPEQFAEKRAPIQDELADAAPVHPVYIQLFYRWAMLNPKGSFPPPSRTGRARRRRARSTG